MPEQKDCLGKHVEFPGVNAIIVTLWSRVFFNLDCIFISVGAFHLILLYLTCLFKDFHFSLVLLILIRLLFGEALLTNTIQHKLFDFFMSQTVTRILALFVKVKVDEGRCCWMQTLFSTLVFTFLIYRWLLDFVEFQITLDFLEVVLGLLSHQRVYLILCGTLSIILQLRTFLAHF